MALTTDQLALHMGLTESGETLDTTLNTRLTLIRQSAEAEIDEYVGSSVVRQQQRIWLPSGCSATYGMRTRSRQNKNLNPLRASGAMALLVRHREISLGDLVVLTDQQLLDAGFTQAEVDALTAASNGREYISEDGVNGKNKRIFRLRKESKLLRHHHGSIG